MPIYEVEVLINVHAFISVEASSQEDAERFAVNDAENAIGMLGGYSGDEIEAISSYEVKEADNSSGNEN